MIKKKYIYKYYEVSRFYLGSVEITYKSYTITTRCANIKMYKLDVYNRTRSQGIMGKVSFPGRNE